MAKKENWRDFTDNDEQHQMGDAVLMPGATEWIIIAEGMMIVNEPKKSWVDRGAEFKTLRGESEESGEQLASTPVSTDQRIEAQPWPVSPSEAMKPDIEKTLEYALECTLTGDNGPILRLFDVSSNFVIKRINAAVPGPKTDDVGSVPRIFQEREAIKAKKSAPDSKHKKP